jgi:hypothetical protein
MWWVSAWIPVNPKPCCNDKACLQDRLVFCSYNWTRTSREEIPCQTFLTGSCPPRKLLPDRHHVRVMIALSEERNRTVGAEFMSTVFVRSSYLTNNLPGSKKTLRSIWWCIGLDEKQDPCNSWLLQIYSTIFMLQQWDFPLASCPGLLSLRSEFQARWILPRNPVCIRSAGPLSLSLSLYVCPDLLFLWTSHGQTDSHGEIHLLATFSILYKPWTR